MVKISERISKALFLLAACVSILAVALICVFIFANGVPAIAEIGLFDFLTGTTWSPETDTYGIAPMILGSLYITAGAIIIGVPLGILTAVFIARFSTMRLNRLLMPVISLLAGIPSVIYGLVGLSLVVPLISALFGGNGSSILAASVTLAIMILPTIVGVSVTSIQAVPESYYEGSLALGASHERSVFSVQLPAAKSGVASGVILGIGRAIGETMAVVMIAGNQARIPTSLLKGVRTMTTNIVLELGYATDLHRGALIATAVVLFVFILIINFLFSLIKNRK